MWMPSDQPLLDGDVEELALDWEAIGRAIRECVLEAIEMKAAEFSVPCDGNDLDVRPDRRIELE